MFNNATDNKEKKIGRYVQVLNLQQSTTVFHILTYQNVSKKT